MRLAQVKTLSAGLHETRGRRTVWQVSAVQRAAAPREPAGGAEVVALLPTVQRVVGARVADRAAAEDLVQETLVRVLAAAGRVEPGMLEPYAIVTARNLVASRWKEQDRYRRNQHRVVDLRPVEAPDEGLLAREEGSALATALARLSERERQLLLAHEVSGQDTRSLTQEVGSSAGAVAAQLNRARARLRVEYLLVLERAAPPTNQCRPGVRPVRRAEPAAAGARPATGRPGAHTGSHGC